MDIRGQKEATDRPVGDWLAPGCLPYLRNVAQRVAYTYNVSQSDVPDLLQELCLALWKAGPDRVVNATWIFHTANHLAIEILRRARRSDRLSAAFGTGAADHGFQDRQEAALLMHARVGTFPPRLRRFCELRFEQGYTQRELMNATNLTRGTVREIEKRCLRRLAGRPR
jgi:RNA polymerase sigma factor (sigma-70 family)